MVLLGAGIWNVTATRGPDWDASSFADQDGGQPGIVVRPDRATLTEWAGILLNHGNGGWAPWRSAVCIFPTGEFFFKAGDEGWFDLAYDPTAPPVFTGLPGDDDVQALYSEFEALERTVFISWRMGECKDEVKNQLQPALEALGVKVIVVGELPGGGGKQEKSSNINFEFEALAPAEII